MLLTRIREKDLSQLYWARNDENIWKWCRQFDVIDETSHKRWFERLSSDRSISMYAIRNEELGEPIGACGLTDIDFINRRAEFSVYIMTAYQKQGNGQKALAALLEKAFNSYNLNIVWGETFDGNPAIRTFEKIGFVREGTRRQFYYRKGEYIDAHLYSISREEWSKTQSKSAST
jgi:UDP-4-amino-4,6-dideoxy-N-acetyl-beta-L-altrosamine N-acetyltransferase